MIALSPHADAVLELMATAALPNGPIPVGDGVAPRSPDGKVVAPCAVLHLTPMGEVTGSLGEANTDVIVTFQVTSVGHVAAQARAVADAVNAVLEGATAAVEGRSTVRIGRPPGRAPIGRPERDDALTPPLFFVPVEYRLWTVPGPTVS